MNMSLACVAKTFANHTVLQDNLKDADLEDLEDALMHMDIETLPLADGHKLYFTGPPLSAGPLPALFYFCSTGPESLGNDPYNQPVLYLQKHPIRVFSLSLPLHDEIADRRQAVALWSKALANGEDHLTPFLEQANDAIDYVVKEGIAVSTAIGVAGLSRGGWVATHLAASNDYVKAIVGFAPLTDLFVLDEFKPIEDNPLLQTMSLDAVIDKLVGKPLRYYVGNRDMRISTDACYAFVRRLTELSYASRHRSAPVELIMSPSIGHLGHGTTTQTFHLGAQWLLNILGLVDRE
ncbi:MAG: alpha/beta hydrolase [Nitrosomonas sp.]|nr:MAG: alpha/beta hydrolase [Nitrosomonas sp.]